MRKYTQRELKHLVKTGAAKILNLNFSDTKDFIENCNFDKIGYSEGVYGINGGLIQDKKSGELYAITARNTTLMMIF